MSMNLFFSLFFGVVVHISWSNSLDFVVALLLLLTCCVLCVHGVNVSARTIVHRIFFSVLFTIFRSNREACVL